MVNQIYIFAVDKFLIRSFLVSRIFILNSHILRSKFVVLDKIENSMVETFSFHYVLKYLIQDYKILVKNIAIKHILLWFLFFLLTINRGGHLKMAASVNRYS